MLLNFTTVSSLSLHSHLSSTQWIVLPFSGAFIGSYPSTSPLLQNNFGRAGETIIEIGTNKVYRRCLNFEKYKRLQLHILTFQTSVLPLHALPLFVSEWLLVFAVTEHRQPRPFKTLRESSHSLQNAPVSLQVLVAGLLWTVTITSGYRWTWAPGNR